MNKKMKLLALLSMSVLLSAGASTVVLAAGWTEESGSWAYYNKDGSAVTNDWKKSGNDWYWLDGDGLMALDQLVEDDGEFYYVDSNGVMCTNQWVSIKNKDADIERGPEQWWYYFKGDGRAFRNVDGGKVASKTIDGKQYAFASDGKMLYGWIEEDDASLMTDDDEAWKTGDYYFGDENDGAMAVGWRQFSVTDDDAENDKWINPAFTGDKDQTRWFYFIQYGKKAAGSDEGGEIIVKEKTINGLKYAFDAYGRMLEDWSFDFHKIASPSVPEPIGGPNGEYWYDPEQSSAWTYYRSGDDGKKVTKGWIKAVPPEYLNPDGYDDEEEGWYYSDANGHIYAGEIRTINKRKYAFDDTGKMISGLHFLRLDSDKKTILQDIEADNEYLPFDTEEGFDQNSGVLACEGGDFFYFGSEDEGFMTTGYRNIDIDGDSYRFNFRKSDGSGFTGEENRRLYNHGKLMQADKYRKYQLVSNAEKPEGIDQYSTFVGYWK